jgi:hypothetical protein
MIPAKYHLPNLTDSMLMDSTLFRSHLFSAIIYCIYLTDATVKLAFELLFILEEFTNLYALCTIIYLLYSIINQFQIRSTGRMSDGLNLVHGLIIALLIVISIVELAYYIGYMVTAYEGVSRWRVSWHWVQCARRLTFWVASLEIAIWAFCLVVRTSKNDRRAKVCQVSLENAVLRLC